jgi:phage-related minor tail protein
MRRTTLAESVTVRVEADTEPFRAALDDLQELSESFGRQLTSALKSAVVSGKDLDDILWSVALNLAGMALNQGLQPLQALTGNFFSSILGGLGGILPFARGGVIGNATPFASGGVVSAPSYFPAGGRIGVMGEAGPEAILPLSRAADGRLGVASAGGGGAVNVVFNVTTQDAGSFRKSEAQITGMLARAVSRGSRTF